ncbi:MAG: TIGR00341 family protein [Candidatus Azobacteroides sp.]|nr:TIGR00341 family protein [Candidatus Azobacteroides sp.]
MFQKLFNYITLRGQIEDFDEIHDSIIQGIRFRGTNLWVLVLAILIACVGLNINSSAMIIGAMLISPLMGPITGMGYSIAIYDMGLFRQALKNLLFAVGASLIASTLYFSITPVSVAYSELLARTSPTIYDVLVALFGGVAGIIAISSKQKGNVIPGVAIATALMPPLCTAGYGLATSQFSFFFGAFYLFTINAVCIAFAAVIVSQALKFPIRSSNINEEKKHKINRIIWTIIIITILPSIYLGHKLTQEEAFRANAERFTQRVSIYKGNYLLKNEVYPAKKRIILIYGGSSLTEADKDSISVLASLFSLPNAEIEIQQGLTTDTNLKITQTKAKVEEDLLKQEITRLNEEVKVQQYSLDSIQDRITLGKVLLQEIQPLFPSIRKCSYSETIIYPVDSLHQTDKTDIVTFAVNRRISAGDEGKIKEWLKQRLNKEDIKVYFENLQ